MPSLRRATLLLIAALVAVAALIVMQDWRLWQRYLTQPDDVADPAKALWFSPRARIGEGPGQPWPIAGDSGRTLPKSALESAWSYAQSMGTDALIVAQDGVIQLERYAPGIDQETLFQSQSLHKGLTAMALGAAVGTGAIPSAATPASTYLTEWSENAPANAVTLADLAYMQAGLERPRYANHPFSPGLQLFLTGRLVERALATPFVAGPRESFIWSNASTQSLSIAIERAVGKPWAEFIGEALWSPIGAGEAYVQLDRPDGTAFSFCCLVTNARNWLRVGQLMLNDGRIDGRRLLPKGWVTAMTTGGATNPNYGMQLWLNEPYDEEILRNGVPRLVLPRGTRLAASDAFYFEGHFAQRLHVVPSAGLVVVRLGDDRRDWDDARLMNGLITATQEREAATPLPSVTPPARGFDEEPKAAAPDYASIANWAAHPGKRDAADFTPDGRGADDPETNTAAFYVSPTTYRGETWNADVGDAPTNRAVDAVVAGQASVLNECCAVYAPRYRQAGAASVYDPTGSGPKAFALAFEDVRTAFDHFLAEIDDRPFILMGHSQGAFHVQRLVGEVVVPRGLSDRLVVAYVVGVAVPRAIFAGPWQPLEACRSALQTRCVMSWVTFGPDANARMYQGVVAKRFPQYARPDGGIDVVCTNPLSGSEEPAEAAANLGAVPVPVPGAYLGAPKPGLVGAACDQGLLRLSASPGEPFETLVFAGENYHFYDVALFYENVRRDATARASVHQ